MFTLTLDCQCVWCLKLETSELRRENCQFLAEVDVKLSSVDALVKFLVHLDESTFCEGNADSKFVHLIECHKDVFKDHSGVSLEYLFIYLMSNLHWFAHMQVPKLLPTMITKLCLNLPFAIVSMKEL